MRSVRKYFGPGLGSAVGYFLDSSTTSIRARTVTRRDLVRARRIVLKAGTSTIVGPDGLPCLNRIVGIVEQIFALRRTGRDVVFVSSGACGLGRNTVRRQSLLNQSLWLQMTNNTSGARTPGNNTFTAVGQANLLALYTALFQPLGMELAQVLLTRDDFITESSRENLKDTLESLLEIGVVPIVNENDTVTSHRNKDRRLSDPFWDNDGLASLVAKHIQADLLILMTDVDGLYTAPPGSPNSKLISIYQPDKAPIIGPKSGQGRGGMEAKVQAALRAVEQGIPATVICSGNQSPSCVLQQVCAGETVGTLFVEDPDNAVAFEENQSSARFVEQQADGARSGGRALAALSGAERSTILEAVAQSVADHVGEILETNRSDLQTARETQLAAPLLNRLELTEAKIATIVDGIRSLARMEDPLGKVLRRTEVKDGLILQEERTPIGVLLVIFESRPDCLPQIAALSLRSGNGVILKGGHEAERTCYKIHQVIVEAVHKASNGRVPKSCIGLVTSRADVYSLLKMDKHIDLCIPRGSGAMIRKIQNSTKIPVLGHSDGVCHVYVHPSADTAMASRILVDSKANYPAACNAAETVLLDIKLVTENNGARAKEMLGSLRAAGVTLLGGPAAMQHALCDAAAESTCTEYGDLKMTVEVVDDVDAAVAYINRYGSHHTETIVAGKDGDSAVGTFLRCVDSACVFHNASTRFADGYRFGLGAEVGISTGKLHARGPVGVEGLLSQKWTLRSAAPEGSTVAETNPFTHRNLPLQSTVKKE